MNRLFKIIFFALLAQGVLAVNGSPAKDDSLRFEVLLTSKMLTDIQFSGTFISDLDITSSQFVLLATNNRFYLLGWGGVQAVGQELQNSISSFAYTPDNFLMIVHNKDLCSLDSLGNLSRLFGLPEQSMGISAGENAMYVYDRNREMPKHALYVLARGGKYAKLFEVPEPISSVIEKNNSILFATNNKLFGFNLTTKELKVLTVLPKDKEIKSITVDTTGNIIYVSTESSVYALKDSVSVMITNELGGVLRFFDDGLIVFNAEKKLLIRISGIEDKIALQNEKTSVKEKPKTVILNNSTIINLVKTKISDELIINLINSSDVSFNVGVDSMIFLSDHNVSSGVIMAMKNAMKANSGTGTGSNNSGNIIIPDNQISTNNNISDSSTTIIKKYYIIAGSYPTELQANEAVADLKKKGFSDAEVVGKNSYGSYRLAYKGYATNGEAAKDLVQIRQSINNTAWIFEKK